MQITRSTYLERLTLSALKKHSRIVFAGMKFAAVPLVVSTLIAGADAHCVFAVTLFLG